MHFNKITFAEFLREKAMNLKTFSATKSKHAESALVGFEFEMWLPLGSDLLPPDNRKSYPISRFDTLDEFEEYFEMNGYERKSILNDYNEWVDEQKEDFIKSHVDRYADDEHDESELRSEAEDKFDSEQDHDFATFIKDIHRNSSKFIDYYSLQPRWGWVGDRETDVYIEDNHAIHMSDIADDFKQSFEDYTGFQIGDSEDGWQITEDSSLTDSKGNENGVGVELISPPTKLSEALNDMERVFYFMKHIGADTNKSTGLHINISIPGIKDNLDPLKLILFMGESHILQQFSRLGNSYAQQHVPKIVYALKDGKVIPKSNEVLSSAWRVLTRDKYRTVNLGKLQLGYLEFRAPGGTDYHLNKNKIEQTVLRLVTALDIACDPNAEREEYIKKISKLFNMAAIPSDIKVSMPEYMPKALARIYAMDDKRIMRQISEYLHAAEDDKKQELILSAVVCNDILKRQNTVMTEKERAYFKMEAKRIGLTTSDVDNFYNEPEDQPTRQSLKKLTGL